MADHQAIVRDVAQTLGLLETDGRLMTLDSLMIIDLAIAIEEATGAVIPGDRMKPANFTSIDSVAAVLASL